MIVPLHHRDLGGFGHPPLVLLHGLLGSSRNWQTAGRDLARRFHVLAPDLRNHGLSPHADEMTYRDMAADVLSWMDALKLGRVTLVGHSMGGKVAMLLACTHPDRVERLILVDVAPKNYFWPAHRREFAAMNALDLVGLRSRAEAEKSFEKEVPEWSMRKFLTTNLERADSGGWRWVINLPALTAALPSLEKDPLGPGERFAGQTLIVAGGRSDYVKAQDLPAIAARFPNSRLVVIEEAGHNPHFDARDKFVEALLGAALSGPTTDAAKREENPPAPRTHSD